MRGKGIEKYESKYEKNEVRIALASRRLRVNPPRDAGGSNGRVKWYSERRRGEVAVRLGERAGIIGYRRRVNCGGDAWRQIPAAPDPDASIHALDLG